MDPELRAITAIILTLSEETGLFEHSNITFDPRNPDTLPSFCYIFPSAEARLDESRQALLRSFDVTEFVANRACAQSSGYFGCKAEDDGAGELVSYSTWLRFIMKMVRKTHGSPYENGPEYVGPNKRDYRWFEAEIYTRWNRSGRCQVLCSDVPPDLPMKLQAALTQRPYPHNFRDPFAMHVDLINQIIEYYDISAWRFRDLVRTVEQTRSSAENTLEAMRPISNTAFHISESISAAIGTLKELQWQQMEMHRRLDLWGTKKEQARQHTSFQLNLLKNIELRSHFVQKRILNEITLAYNVAATRDTSNMKIISVLTVLFLPFTFIAVLLTTPMFKWPDPPEGQVLVTLPFIIYFTASFGISVVIGIFMWYFGSSQVGGLGGIQNIFASCREKYVRNEHCIC